MHSFVRRREAAIEMMRSFYRDGLATQTCGPAGCVCQDGGCGAELP